MRDYGVSRNAVREALDLLRDEGLVERRQGLGTFVVAKKAMHSFDKLRSVADGVRMDADMSFEVLTMGVLPTPVQVAELLGLEAGEPTLFMERRMFLDEEPFSIRASWMPRELAGPLLRADLSRLHFYSLVARELGLKLVRGRIVIEAVIASESAARLLEVTVGAPLFLMERISYLEDGRPFEFGFTRTRSDRVALAADMVVDTPEAVGEVVADPYEPVENGQFRADRPEWATGVTPRTSS